MTVNMEMPHELVLLTNNAIRHPAPSIFSDLFCIRATPYTGGLGAFALTTIPAGTQVFRAQEPFVKVVYGPYKKEVCAQCFCYDRGRKMKQVETSVGSKEKRGIAWFCSEACWSSWRQHVKAQDLETLSRVAIGMSKVQKGKMTSTLGKNDLSPADIENAWETAVKSPIPKSLPLMHEEDDQDTVYFLLDGIMARSRNTAGWDAFLSLNPSLQPYDTPGTLESHIRIFHFLRFNLTEPLRSFCLAETILALVTRDHGNSFGIFEDELGRDGEMLGYGTWTEASFFNHSCEANLTKRRSGRSYVFTAKRDIQPDEEVCINYIEDAVAEPVNVRRKRLHAGWGFVCGCARCMDEEGAAAS